MRSLGEASRNALPGVLGPALTATRNRLRAYAGWTILTDTSSAAAAADQFHASNGGANRWRRNALGVVPGYPRHGKNEWERPVR